MERKANPDLPFLRQKALEIRQDVLRSLTAAGSGHLGASLGMADVFTLLYFNEMNHRPANPAWKGRDRLILSIGHIAPLLYATLAHAGYFPVEELVTLRKLGSRLQGHPGKDFGLPGIEVSSGSLGQGLSISVGMALAGKMDHKDWRVFCILGDGELQEGSVWEAAMSAAHHHLSKLVAIIDRNHCQIDGPTSGVMELEPLEEKWKAFGWQVYSCNGHDMSELDSVFRTISQNGSGPSVVIAHTTMGKGVKSIEGDYRWHGKAPSRDELDNFLQQLSHEKEGKEQ